VTWPFFHFYTLVTKDTREREFARKRQMFL